VQGRPGLAALGGVLILFGYAIVVAVEFVLVAKVNRPDAAPQVSKRQLLTAWWGEVLTIPKVFNWRQPFFSHSEPDLLPADAAGRVGVVFVHGFLCNRALWNPLLKRLRERGIPFVAVDLEPVFGSIDAYAPIVERAVGRVEDATGKPPLVVAHSMGGLAVRAWLRAFHADERTRHVITIASPHRGTHLASLSCMPNTRQMRRNSAWQAGLVATEPARHYQRFTCFYGHCDNIVLPASSATLPGADNRHLPAVAHVCMVYHERVFSEILRRVQA